MSNLSKIRASKGLTQTELASKLGFTKQRVSILEHERITPKNAVRCAEVLNVSPFEILGTDVFTMLPLTTEDKKILLKITKDLCAE